VAKKVKILKLTQIRSSIGFKPKAKATLEALGLKNINHTVEKNDSPCLRGMINKIPYLLKVEEI
tara:strand:+ start:2839 stop:3030 length:192 start_codon:yes stop_codon:yes gene_type:complete